MQIETRYARNGDATIAWTTAGSAPTDLLFIPGFISHVEHLWEQPGLAGFFERLMGFTRLLVMDRRGCGLSDPRTEALDLQEEAGDVLAVLAGGRLVVGMVAGHRIALAAVGCPRRPVDAIARDRGDREHERQEPGEAGQSQTGAHHAGSAS